MLDRLDILRWFAVARWLDREGDRARLERRQARLLNRLIHHVLPRSPFYRDIGPTALTDLPIIEKAEWMAAFDRINTVGIRHDEALALAEQAERTRDFKSTLNGVTVGLSTGTSGRRGVFLVSPAERRRWAGVMLAKLLPSPIFRRRRVAFLLRAGSRLYDEAGRAGPILFKYFDLQKPWETVVASLGSFAPHIVIAPAGVLRLLANIHWRDDQGRAPENLISVAETLHDDDRSVINRAFPESFLGEVYQATEGALAMTCERGSLHLNEAFVHVEPAWIDRPGGAFSPIVTDLTRTTQPVVRYRLDDVLRFAERPCACGRASRTIAAIEGRCDDILWLPSAKEGQSGTRPRVPIYPDFVVRRILGASAHIEDFHLKQREPATLELGLAMDDTAQALTAVAGQQAEDALTSLARELGAKDPLVKIVSYRPPTAKRRRVVGLADGKTSQ